MRPEVTSPEAREILKKHRRLYDSLGDGGSAKVSTIIEDFGAQHPEYRSLTRSRSDNLQPREDLYLSPVYSEVRAPQVQKFINSLRSTRADGVQVEFVLGYEDENGVVPYGYEDLTVTNFLEKYGKNPLELPNNDSEWMQFRADYVTLFLSELRVKVKEVSEEAVLSATIIAGDQGDYIKVLLSSW